MPGEDGADAPAKGDAHSDSEGSAFSDHKSQDGDAQDAARKADEDKEKKGGGMFARFGFVKKESAAEGRSGIGGGKQAASREEDDEEAEYA